MMLPKPPTPEAMWSAYNELQLVKKQERDLTIRRAQLTKTLNALYPLVFGDVPDMDALSLPNAIRLIISGADRPLSAQDMKTKLEDSGFDLSKYPNPIANILTAMKRMAESEELVYIDGDKKRVAAGPELKPAPDVPGDWEGAMAGLAGLIPRTAYTRRHLGTREKNQTNDFRNSIHAKGELLCRSDRHQSEEIGKGHSRLAGFECPLWGRSSIGAEQRTLNP